MLQNSEKGVLGFSYLFIFLDSLIFFLLFLIVLRPLRMWFALFVSSIPSGPFVAGHIPRTYPSYINWTFVLAEESVCVLTWLQQGSKRNLVRKYQVTWGFEGWLRDFSRGRGDLRKNKCRGQEGRNSMPRLPSQHNTHTRESTRLGGTGGGWGEGTKMVRLGTSHGFLPEFFPHK